MIPLPTPVARVRRETLSNIRREGCPLDPVVISAAGRARGSPARWGIEKRAPPAADRDRKAPGPGLPCSARTLRAAIRGRKEPRASEKRRRGEPVMRAEGVWRSSRSGWHQGTVAAGHNCAATTRCAGVISMEARGQDMAGEGAERRGSRRAWTEPRSRGGQGRTRGAAGIRGGSPGRARRSRGTHGSGARSVALATRTRKGCGASRARRRECETSLATRHRREAPRPRGPQSVHQRQDALTAVAQVGRGAQCSRPARGA
jgi:hypothetical protein